MTLLIQRYRTNSTLALMQSPYVQEAWYQAYVQQYGEEPRFAETEDALAVRWGNRFVPLAWPRTQ